MRRIAPVFLTALLALPAAAGTVYKWTDAAGQVHYTQTPPPEGAMRGAAQRSTQQAVQPGVTLNAPPPPAPPKAEGKPANTPPPETAAAKAQRCAAAKERLAFLEERTPRRLMIEQPDGSTSRMTEEEFAERVAKAQEASKGC